MQLSKHITNVRALQFFQIFRFGILLLISIIFTKTNLGIGEIGVYETFLLVAGSVSFFWIGGMLQSLLSIFNNNQSFGKLENSPALFNVFVLFTALSILSAIFVLASQSFIAQMLSLTGNRIPYMKILFMYIVVSGPVNLIEYVYLLKNKAVKIVIYGISTFGLQLICVTAPVLLGYDLGYGLYGLVFINIIRFLWLIVLVFKYSEIKISTHFIKEFFRLSSPLVFSILLSGSAQYIDGFLISWKFDEATFAIFRYGARELPFVVLLIAAFGNAMTPKFSEPQNLIASLTELKNGTRNLMHWLYPVSIVFVLTSKFLYPIVFNPQFVDSALIFNIYLLIMITRFMFTRIILIGFKDTKPILISSFIEIVLNVAISLILIQFWGIAGVAIATVISYVIEKLYLMIYLNAKHNVKPKQYIDLKVFIIYSVALTISFLVSLLY